MAIRDDPDLLDSSDTESESEPGLMLARMPLNTRARVQPLTRDDLPQELLDSIHNLSVLEQGVPYVNTAWASNDMVDSYGTRMRPSSLKNYAQDATNGISLQNSHRTNELPIGRTYLGRFKGSRAGGNARTEMDFYIPPGLSISGVNTSDVIKAIDYGSVHDVSIGFYGGNLMCSLDGKPMMGDLLSLLFFGSGDDEEVRDPGAPCNHLPGIEYNLRDSEGRKTGDRAVAIGEVDGAHCAELSLVFDGATPMAQISGRSAPVFRKAFQMADMDILPRDVALGLESRFRGVRFPALTTPRFFVDGRAEWTSAYKNDLPDSAFAYIEPGGKKDKEGKTTPRSLRHYPHHDKDGKVDVPHLRNALARAAQNPSTGKKALAHLKRHAKSEGVGEESRDMSAHFDPDDLDLREILEHGHEEPEDRDVAEGPDTDQDKKETGEMPEQPTESSSPPPEEGHTETTLPTVAYVPTTGTNGVATTGSSTNGTVVVTSTAADTVVGLRSALVAAGLAPEGFQGDLAVRFNELGREVSDLRLWAEIGRQAREQLVEDCRKAGIRAFGKKWSETPYGGTFTRGSYAELQELHKHWTDVGNQRFQGGRATDDGLSDPQPAQPEPVKVPARAYRA